VRFGQVQQQVPSLKPTSGCVLTLTNAPSVGTSVELFRYFLIATGDTKCPSNPHLERTTNGTIFGAMRGVNTGGEASLLRCGSARALRL
jgi:hypothetical protein